VQYFAFEETEEETIEDQQEWTKDVLWDADSGRIAITAASI
jgi:hypothetical protein